jgi:hypothetical protein
MWGDMKGGKSLAELSPRVAELSPRLAELSPMVAEHSPRLALLSPMVAEHSPCLALLFPRLALLSPHLALVKLSLALLDLSLAGFVPGVADKAQSHEGFFNNKPPGVSLCLRTCVPWWLFSLKRKGTAPGIIETIVFAADFHGIITADRGHAPGVFADGPGIGSIGNGECPGQ